MRAYALASCMCLRLQASHQTVQPTEGPCIASGHDETRREPAHLLLVQPAEKKISKQKACPCGSGLEYKVRPWCRKEQDGTEEPHPSFLPLWST